MTRPLHTLLLATVTSMPGGCYIGAQHAGGEGGVVSGDGGDEGAPQDCEATQLDALQVLQDHCVACHVPEAGNAFDYLTDLERLVAEGMLVPGDAAGSPLLVAATDQHAPSPDVDELAAVAAWIDGCLQTAPCVTDHVIGVDGMLELMRADLQAGVSSSARQFTRYFTLTHLYDAGLCGDALDAEREGLAKVLNSLSWSPQLVVPEPIDPDGTIFRVDLRDYDWEDGVWARLVAADPYAIAYTREEATDVVAFTGTPVPSMRADWFVAAATAPPLYYDLLGLPATRAGLEAELGVDIDADVAADEVERAGFLESEVSQHNRVIERHELPGGPGRSLWTSYEFDADAAASDVFAHPLDFVSAAQMHMFTLPNGLHGYMLTDASGQRIDALSDEIAIDLAEPDHDLVVGRSCMRCHGGGVIPRADELLEHVGGSLEFDDATRERIERLHPLAEDFRATQQLDADRYAAALAQLGVSAAELGRSTPCSPVCATTSTSSSPP
ncbi:MAG: hypothetical protein IAG13_33410, partial [Deltaproteobacteria bacterium]|nr:hypothetical protein [Nannocystaceae bacterium]